VVAVAERQFDVLVPPLRPVPDPAVAQQVLLQFGEAGPQVADLDADGVAVQGGFLVGGRRVGVGGLLWKTWSEERSTRTSSTPGVSRA
jgi:hypothetical protein